ncbi:hypothetical protein EBAPG3_012830 [Nitrosospira lacus]|uniref:Uncharacterized protein n=1 Tax=Nitrosospira lacus TaxID=1288494 RepID=A0A1W6SS10_9PROT|nr:hypothetical protein EBAPG3_012830 [Nitrosospira lacus]
MDNLLFYNDYIEVQKLTYPKNIVMGSLLNLLICKLSTNLSTAIVDKKIMPLTPYPCRNYMSKIHYPKFGN